MSYNRGGYRQDNRQSYRSNMGYNSNQRGTPNVSPWECGVAPNAALSRVGIQSLLPSPPQMQANTNILSQQQHALVMASNLLSNLGLLSPQHAQQNRSQQELPSLLNMRSLGNTPSFRLAQNYNNRGSNNRYGNVAPMRRNKPMESHRVEPYKNRGRQAASQVQQPGRRLPPNKPTGSKPAAGTASGTPDNRAKRQKTTTKAVPTNASEANGVKLGAVETKPGEDVVPAKIEEDEEAKRGVEDDDSTKRDWKTEKPGEEGDEKMEIEKTGDGAKEGEEGAVIEGEDKTEDEADDKGVTKIFSCHVCNRHFTDETGLKSHVAVKTHTNKMNKLDASYKAKAEEMRMAMKRSVQKQEVDIRHGKKPPVASQDYCKMCDLNFYGTIVNHRKNDMHLALKTFLHPRCVTCNREFPTRMEWDLHRLTVGHQQRERRKHNDVQAAKSSGVRSVKVEVAAGGDGKVGATFDRSRGKTAVKVDSTYDAQVPVGMEFLSTGQHCKMCEMFFERRFDAKVHCMSEEHFNLCLAKAKEAAAVAESEKLKKEEAEKAAKEAAAADPAAVNVASETPATETSEVENEPGTDDEEGNWKRRRVTDASVDGEQDVVAVAAEPVVGAQLYDPLETADDDVMEVPQDAGETPLADHQGDIMEALDREIGDILESAGVEEANGIKDEGEVVDVSPKTAAGGRGRRGGRGTAVRGKKRKY